MFEQIEFRLNPSLADKLLPPSLGETISDDLGRPSLRRISVPTGCAAYEQILSAERQSGRKLMFSWSIARTYSRKELESAQLLLLKPKSWFEPERLECGTKEDHSNKCPHCGGGIRQVGDLILDLRRPSKKKQIACSIGYDVIFSQELADLMRTHKITGCDLRPVRHRPLVRDHTINYRRVPKGREVLRMAEKAGVEPYSIEYYQWMKRPDIRQLADEADEEYFALLEKAANRAKPPPPWFQPVSAESRVKIVSPTRLGIDPGNDDAEGRYRCPHAPAPNHVLGLTVLSEVHVDRGSYDGSDVCWTANLLGQFGIPYEISFEGILKGGGTGRYVGRYYRLMLISQRFYRLLIANNIRGFAVEVVHLV